MQYDILNITVDYAKAGLPGGGAPKLYTYLRDRSPEIRDRQRPAIVICPGGGYGGTSDREAEPIALRFLAEGFSCFVLRYSCLQAPFPGALLELAAAVALVRQNAAAWQVDPNKIMVCGFSAGGHLAASLGVFWNRDLVTGPLGLHHQEHRPNGLILGYPVITSGEYAHRGSFQNLLADRYDEYVDLVSLETQVSADTPPCFLWHTADDEAVPAENSLLFAAALQKQRIPYEMHILPSGPHGLSLATEETDSPSESCKDWTVWATRWIRSL